METLFGLVQIVNTPFKPPGVAAVPTPPPGGFGSATVPEKATCASLSDLKSLHHAIGHL